MPLHVDKNREVPITSLLVGDRILPPTETGVERMMKSLEANGQISAISVRHVTANDFRVVAGATRVEAAKRLRWATIRADIITVDHELEYQVVEIEENLERRDLTSNQRKLMRQQRAELQRQLLAVEPAKGGRGKKGGVSEAARRVGISRRAAARHRQNVGASGDTAHVSANGPKSKPKHSAFQIGVKYDEAEYQQIKAEAKRLALSLSNTVRMHSREHYARNSEGQKC